MFLSELLKALRKKEFLILFVVGIFLEIMIASQNNIILPGKVKVKLYKEYLRQVEGDYTKEKQDWLVGERDYYRMYLDQRAEYEEKYQSGEIASAEYSEFLDNFRKADERIDTLEFLVSRSMYLEGLSSSTGHVRYFYDLDINDYVENMGIDIVLVLLITVVVVHIFGEDTNCGTQYMIITSKHGRRKLFQARIKCMLLITMFFGILFPVVEWMTKNNRYHLGDMDADICCLSSMSGSGLHMSIRQYLLLCVATRAIAAVFYGVVVMAITMLVHNMISDYVIGIGLLYLPYLVYKELGKYIKVLTMCRGLAVYKGYGDRIMIAGMHGMGVWLLLYLIISVGVVTALYIRWEPSPI